MTQILAVNVRSDTFPGGGSIKLDWEYPADFDPLVHTLYVLRKERAFSETETDGDVVLSTSDTTEITFVDGHLKDNTYYYYTWVITDGTSFWFNLGTQDWALSARKWGFSDILYKEFPNQQRVLDTTLDLKRLCDIWGQAFDIYKSEVFAFGYMRSGVQSNPETMPALVNMLGLDKLQGLSLDVLRRAAIHAVFVYKNKGTARGIVEAVKLLTGWDASLGEARNLIFKTWDGQSRTDYGNTFAVASGVVVDPLKNFQINEWASSLFVDDDRARYQVISNDATSINIAKSGNPVFFQIASIATSVGFGFLADTSQNWAVNAYRAGELIDSAGEHHRIVSNTATQVNFSDPFRKPRPGAYTIRPYWQVFQGDHTLLYNDLEDHCLRGRANDPFSQLYNPSTSVTVISLKNTDVVITVTGVAQVSGYVGSVTPTTLTDPGAHWTPNAFVGMNLNPNSLQNLEFPIVSNTTDTITVAAPASMDAISQLNNRYFVMKPRDSIKLKRLRDLLPDFMAFFARPVIFFEPTEC